MKKLGLCAMGALILAFAKMPALAADEGCKILAGKDIVVVTGLPAATKAGRLCIEAKCSDLTASKGIVTAYIKTDTGAAISFVPQSAVAGCATVVERKSELNPAIVTGAFTFLAGFIGLLGTMLLDHRRRTTEQHAAAAEWVETYRRKLATWRGDASADPSSPSLTVTHRGYRAELDELRRQIETLVEDMATGSERLGREKAYSAALAILKGWT